MGKTDCSMDQTPEEKLKAYKKEMEALQEVCSPAAQAALDELLERKQDYLYTYKGKIKKGDRFRITERHYCRERRGTILRATAGNEEDSDPAFFIIESGGGSQDGFSIAVDRCYIEPVPVGGEKHG